MATNLPPEVESHPFVKELGALLGVGLRHYLVKSVHKEAGHTGDLDACGECGLLVRGLDTQGAEIRERLFGSMRDFADRFGY